MRVRITGAVCIAAALTFGLAQSAQADPKNGTPIRLDCSNGQAYDTVGEGQGEFDPVHAIAGTAMFVPTWFGDKVTTVYDQSGNVVFSEEVPSESKGNSAGRQPNELTCSFSFSVYVLDPQAGPLHVVGSGEARGFTTG